VKRLFVLFSIIVVLLVAALVGPSFVDWNKYKPQIIEQAQKATGYEIEIAGDLSMAILPFPHLSIAGLTVNNPDARKQKPLAKAESVSVQVALAPLFSGGIEVSDVSLQSPDIYVVVDKDGQPSWQTAKMKNKQAGEGTKSDLSESVALNSVNIKNGALTYIDLRSEAKHEVSDLNLSVSGDGLMGPYDSEGSLVYNGQKIAFKHESGDLTKLSEALPVEVTASLPDLGTNFSYKGIVAQKDGGVEAQGNLDFKTDAPQKLAKAYKVSIPEHLNKKAAVSGFVTLGGKDVNLREATISYGATTVTGYALISNYKPDASAPLHAELSLASNGVVNFDELMAPKAKATKSTGGFLPASLTLPQDVTGNISFKSPAIILNGQKYQNVDVALTTKDKQYDITAGVGAAGNTQVNFTGAMAFGAKSKSASGKSVTMTEPSVAGTVKVTSQEPDKLAEALAAGKLSDDMKRALAYNLASEVQLKVTPRLLDATAGYVKLDDTRVNFSGSYAKGAERDKATIAASAVTVDADKWLGRMAKKSAAIPTTPASTDVKGIAAGIKVPFDLVYSLDVQGLRLKGRDYLSMKANGSLVGDDLRIDTASLTSNSSDNFALKGYIKDLSKLGGLDVTLQANINDLEQTLASFNLQNISLPARVGKADIISEFKGSPEKLAFTTNVNALRAETQASGVISDTLTAPKVSDLTLRLKHPSYVDLVRLFKPDFTSGVAIKKDVDVFASMKRDGDVYSFSELRATFGPTTLTGDVSVTMGGKPYIKAAVDFTEMPVDSLLGIDTRAKKTDMRKGTTGTTQDVRWSRNAIDTSWMHKANFDVKATGKSISYGGWKFLNAGANVTMKDGTMDLKQLDGAFAGGQVAFTGNMKSSAEARQPLSVAGNFILQNVSIEEFVAAFSGSNKLVKASGDVSITGDVATTGLSPAALVFDLNGKAKADGTNLVFEGFDLAKLSRALGTASTSFTENFTQLLDASMKGGTTRFETLDGQFTIKEGVINFDKMLLSGVDADVDTTGNVNLPLWTVDLLSSVQLKEPEDAPPLKATFKGSLDNPGKTFGQSALNQYFQKQLEGVVLNPVLDKIEGGDTIKKILGVGSSNPNKTQTPTTTQPQTQQVPAETSPAEAVPAEGATSETAPVEQQPAEQNVAPQQQQQQTRPITKEEAIFGVIDGLLGSQR